MNTIKFSLIVISVVVSFVSCTENDSEGPGPIPDDSVDISLTDDQSAFLASAKDTVIRLEDIILENGQDVRSFLETNDPDFLQTYPSGRTGNTKAVTARQQKLTFLAKMLAMGNYLVDDSKHSYDSVGADSPAQNGLVYSWGSKDHNLRQIPPYPCGCMTLKIYGLDCTGMLWAMTKAANLTVVPKESFKVSNISNALTWTNALKASTDYKDLEMKDMGELDPGKIKNGDIILWGSHVGVYLNGFFYQSNGVKDAPGCNNNLQPDKGPRLITLANVMSWRGLGSYKVFRINHSEYNYKVSISIVDSTISPFRGGLKEGLPIYNDKATFDLTIKINSVPTATIDNIDNDPPTVVPTTKAFQGTEFVWIPDSLGELNVDSVTLAVGIMPQDSILEFSLQHKNACYPGIMTRSTEDGSVFSEAQPTPFGGANGLPLTFQVDLKKKVAYFDPSQPDIKNSGFRISVHIEPLE